MLLLSSADIFSLKKKRVLKRICSNLGKVCGGAEVFEYFAFTQYILYLMHRLCGVQADLC